jgi:hypothetical protein
MKWSRSILHFLGKRLLAASLSAMALLGCADIHTAANGAQFTGVGLTGVQHIGPDFNISDFYVNGYPGSNVGRGGGGGSDVCCVSLPNKWRPGLAVEVRWAVGNWSKENRQELAAGNYRSITFERYKAIVPLEKYDAPEQLYVHFFPGGKVRVVSSFLGSRNPAHPILGNDPRAADSATAGMLIKELFTKEELDESDRKFEESKKKHGGWR